MGFLIQEASLVQLVESKTVGGNKPLVAGVILELALRVVSTVLITLSHET